MKLKFKQSRKPIKINFFSPIKLNTKQSIRKIPMKNLTWPQASIRFPRLNPFGDKDHDGKLNMFDCKPFNKKRHGKFTQNIPIKNAKYYTVYHGTQKENNPRILKEGLKTLKSQGSNRQSDDPERYGHVFLSIHKNVASAYGKPSPSRLDNYKANVYKVKIDANTIYPSSTMAYSKDIPIENIKLLKGKEHRRFINKALQFEYDIAPKRSIEEEGTNRIISKRFPEVEKPEVLKSIPGKLSDQEINHRETMSRIQRIKQKLTTIKKQAKEDGVLDEDNWKHEKYKHYAKENKKRNGIETLQQLDTNDNQIPDTAEEVDIKPIEINEKEENED